MQSTLLGAYAPRTHKADLKIMGAPVTAATSLSCGDEAHEQYGLVALKR